MKKITRLFSLCFVAALAVNCSSSDDSPSIPAVIPPSVTTVSVEDINGLSFTANGNITSNGNGVQNFGFCMSEEANPTTQDIVFYVDGSAGGPFSTTITVESPSTTYHVRAFARAVDGTPVYGNDVTFTSAFPIQGMPVTQIVTDRALFSANILTVPDNVYELGYCYATVQNPTMANGDEVNFSQATGYQETMNIVQINPMIPNTTYYVRPYYRLYNDEIFYGPQISFKTAGYFGPAGGYVAYDKGVTTDGWRYLEIDPTAIFYNGNYPQWGCYNTLVSNTYPEMGAGLANTQTIVGGCGAANCAARLCNNYVKNGFSDWYLGSRDEMLIIVRSLRALNIDLTSCWTSTETTATQAYEVYISGNNVLSDVSQKNGTNYVNPIRRY